MKRWGPTLLILGLLAACGQSGNLNPVDTGPTGQDVTRASVDGLTVGHRLMAAGEYELALKSYLRAASEEGANPEIITSIGSANLRLGRLGQAEQLLRNAISQDKSFVPAWNNLGVVLMEKGEIGEAKEVFRTAYALDNGQTDHIRENLRLAIAKIDNKDYSAGEDSTFLLTTTGTGTYKLSTLP